MPELPRGTVTFLFTDIEGSTALWERDRQAMATAVERHLVLLDAAIAAHGGVHFKTVGDAVQAAFSTAPQAVAAAVDGHLALVAEDWGEIGPLKVRMALHAGEALPDDHGDYLAAPLNRLSRLLSTGYGGQILFSQTVQQLTRGALPPGAELRDLGEHRLRDLLEPERVFQLLHQELPDQFPPLKSLENRLNNLPRQPTPFLGRERQVEDVVGLLGKEDVQLLTLVGSGGTGKTRLALQAAAELLDAFADGVFLVELAPLADADLVPSTIGTALGLQEGGTQSPEELVRSFLQHKILLLLLDNFEHLLAAGPVVGRLLNTCPTVKVLATSRAPLRLRAERLYSVPPLATPDSRPPEDPEAIARNEAVQLFIERAQASDPSFMPTPETLPAIADIVRRLDGLPLAIELAAARVRLLPPAALLVRLEQRLPLLTGGARDAPERQRTLRATIAWSHDLLSEDERVLFRRLAIFAGGCTLQAAEAVVNPDEHLDVLGGVAALVDHNLLRQGAGVDNDLRFTMLETINEYAWERLTASGEDAELRHRLAQHFLTFAESMNEQLVTADQAAWFQRFEMEHPNLRAALHWARDVQDGDVLTRLTVALGQYWVNRGHQREAVHWLDQALVADASPTVRMRILLLASTFAYHQGHDRRATALAEEALALAHSNGSAKEIANAQRRLGHALLMEGELHRSSQLLAEALTWYRNAQDGVGEGDVLLTLAEIAEQQGQIEHARTRSEEALDAYRVAADGWGIARSLFQVAVLAAIQGDGDYALDLLGEAESLWQRVGSTFFVVGLARSYRGMLLADHRGDDTQAEPLLMEALTYWQQAGNKESSAALLHELGQLAWRRGDLDLAEARQHEVLALSQEFEDPVVRTIGSVKALIGLGQVSCARGEVAQGIRYFRRGGEQLQTVMPEQWNRGGSISQNLLRTAVQYLCASACAAGRGTLAVRAARVLGAADACRAAILAAPLGAERGRDEQAAASLRGQLSPSAFANEWNAGRTLSVEVALAEALKLLNDALGAPS
jgi:predicted ATPase/class 3 adenylate cyclase